MNINFQKITPMIAGCMTISGVIFQTGKHAEKLDIINLKVEAQEKKETITNQSMNEILSSVNVLRNDVQNIKEDITEIKHSISKLNYLK